MKTSVLQRAESELLVLIQYDFFFEEEPSAQYFWFPHLERNELKEWWVSQSSISKYCGSSQHWGGELVLAATQELKELHDELRFKHHYISIGLGDGDTFLVPAGQDIVYHRGYRGPVHGTPYFIYQKEELRAWFKDESNELRDWFDSNVAILF
ncbi:hypothetical protein [Vibrio sp. 16]|uniref:hypothetical protein n=1 Tax=Vibrio sp. 16 TaxID=391586 RepID=UPI0005C4A9D9|nr:hypothetical protein [Vibrio sp. 16]CAK4070581.1 hypothetical protein VDT1_2541 [Vibrio sp. 16]HCE1504466.1 hypothetical protein [Vibrio parahaemolyticus]